MGRRVLRDGARPQSRLHPRLPDGTALTRAAIAAALAALLGSGPSHAQDRGGGTPGSFDFYVLALSWSPDWCETTGADRGSRQCEAGRRLGFTVHGLWPQYEQGAPRACGTAGAPAAAVEASRDVFPDPGLARHQWRAHGTCSGLTPAAYFDLTRAARDKVAIPEPLQAPDRDASTTAASVERAFAIANPGLRPDMVAVQCRSGALSEVRICLDRDLRGFRSCPEVDRRSSCRFGTIRVSAPR